MKLRTMLPAAAVTIGSLLLVAAPAGATTASETVTAGSLGFASTPGSVTFPATTLNGQNKTVTASQPLDIADATGSGAGLEHHRDLDAVHEREPYAFVGRGDDRFGAEWPDL